MKYKTIFIYKIKIRLFLSILFFPFLIISQSTTIAERIGFDKNTKFLIIHADDIGLAHSVNTAAIKAFEGSGINSASIMVPCPWFPEIAAYAKGHTEYDFGLHLTLNSEWKNYRWGGVLPASEIPSLLDKNNFFYRSVQEIVDNADLKEVEKELIAQVERALAFGVKPTHLDNHMGSLFSTPELFQIYLKIGKIYDLPVFIPMVAKKRYPELMKLIDEQKVIVDNYMMMETNRPATEWNDYYINIIQQLKPGLNELIVHLAIDNSEMQAVMIDHTDFGSTWRQNDLNTMMSKEFKKALKNYNIKLITWKEISYLLDKNDEKL
ncbi:MAG: polysaccharide deacetylase family protein [Bacteroidota bacterium]